MSHSCTPNCQAVVMAANGKLTIALYTLRQVPHEPHAQLAARYGCQLAAVLNLREKPCTVPVNFATLMSAARWA